MPLYTKKKTWLQLQMFASELKIDDTVLNEPFRTHLVTAGHFSTIRPHRVSQSEHVTKTTMSTETIESKPQASVTSDRSNDKEPTGAERQRDGRGR